VRSESGGGGGCDATDAAEMVVTDAVTIGAVLPRPVAPGFNGCDDEPVVVEPAGRDSVVNSVIDVFASAAPCAISRSVLANWRRRRHQQQHKMMQIMITTTTAITM